MTHPNDVIEIHTGRDLAQRRKAAELTQTELGALAGFGRHTVSYWETKPRLSFGSTAVLAILKALGVPYFRTNTRAHVMGSYAATRTFGRIASAPPPTAPLLSKSYPREMCGARTRRGTACQALAIPGKGRCKLHGGLSTGPRTETGRQKISRIQRERWARYRGFNPQ